VRVHIDYRPPVTRIEVGNPMVDGAVDVVPSGFGLVGLRERVQALGGRLDAGPDAGTWTVVARIPHRDHGGDGGR
jgi:signal transduction histidine kinase